MPACEEEIQACRRFLDMRRLALSGRAEYFWSDAHVVDPCAFIELLPHVKAFEGTIVLEPVQCWWVAGIFGFRERGTGLRWVRSASLWVPRKNTKTTLSTGIVLYCANCENEPGAEVTISAGSEKQAAIPYNVIRETLKKEPDLVDLYQAHDTRDYTEFRATGSKITLATSKAENLDGYNPHLVLAEELHAQSQAVIGVLKTAMGSRRNPLFLSISTAGRDTNSPAYDDWKASLAVLKGRMRNDRLFTVIYAGSKEDTDKRFDLKVVEKVNPLWGVSLTKAAIEEEIAEARKSPAKLNEYLRTRLNVWSRAAGNLISVDDWNACANPALNLDAFRGYPMYVGLDLASRNDLNAAAFLVKVGDRLYTVAKYWLGRNCPRMTDDRFADAFAAWAQEGWLELTDAHGGTFVDYKIILKRVLDMLEGHIVIGVGLDDYQANLMASEIELAGHPTFIVQKNARSLTPATEDLIARVGNTELLEHDGNPVTAWCAGNVVGYYDANSNVLPKKETKDSKANIDGIDATIIGNVIRLDHEAGVLGMDRREREKPNPYLARGLAGQAA
ncbi:terminase large subunit [Microvirga massiliensis]|uniref:terminase large subunit n=1 Tax=Microvirga massiliensis TaxID=1033741 RepID=UPI00062B796A|nr:terminase TerL endonuclease subunit [Microvirga massiliensis]